MLQVAPVAVVALQRWANLAREDEAEEVKESNHNCRTIPTTNHPTYLQVGLVQRPLFQSLHVPTPALAEAAKAAAGAGAADRAAARSPACCCLLLEPPPSPAAAVVPAAAAGGEEEEPAQL